MSLIAMVRRMAIRMAGLRVGATDASVAANYDFLATSAQRELMTLAQLRGNDGAGNDLDVRTDASGRLVTIPYGSGTVAFLQDAGQRLVVLGTGVDSGGTNRSIRTDTSGRLQPTIWPHAVLYQVQDCPTILTTAYTVPASTTAVITELILINNNAAARTILVRANAVSIWPTARSIPAAGMVRVPLSRPVAAAQIIEVQASGADVAVTICGVTYA